MYRLLVGQDEVDFLCDLFLEDKNKSGTIQAAKIWITTQLRQANKMTHLEGLVGLCNGQHFVSMVDTAEFTKWTQKPLAVMTVPLQSLLLMLCAREDLEHRED